MCKIKPNFSFRKSIHSLIYFPIGPEHISGENEKIRICQYWCTWRWLLYYSLWSAHKLSWQEISHGKREPRYKMARLCGLVKWSSIVHFKQTKEIVSLFKGEVFKCSILVQIIWYLKSYFWLFLFSLKWLTTLLNHLFQVEWHFIKTSQAKISYSFIKFP